MLLFSNSYIVLSCIILYCILLNIYILYIFSICIVLQLQYIISYYNIFFILYWVVIYFIIINGIVLYCIVFYFILTIHVFYTYTPDTVYKNVQIHRHHYTPVFAAYLSLGLRPAPVEAQHGLFQAIHYHGDWKCGWMNCCQARPMQMIFRSGCNFCKQLSNATGLEAT